jgi:hypothetical protein
VKVALVAKHFAEVAAPGGDVGVVGAEGGLVDLPLLDRSSATDDRWLSMAG